MSISPKLAASGPDPQQFPHWSRRHARQRFQPEVLAQLTADYDYQLKFVVDQPAEIAEVEAFLTHFPELRTDRVLLMPQGTTPETLQEKAHWLEPLCHERGWTYCPRRQIEWFGPIRGT